MKPRYGREWRKFPQTKKLGQTRPFSFRVRNTLNSEEVFLNVSLKIQEGIK